MLNNIWLLLFDPVYQLFVEVKTCHREAFWYFSIINYQTPPPIISTFHCWLHLSLESIHSLTWDCFSLSFFFVEESSYKDENGNIMTDTQGVIRLWRKHLSTLLQGDDDTNTASRDDVPNPLDDDGVEIPPPSHEFSFPAELFKNECNELVGRMNQLIYKIWRGKNIQ